MRLFYFLPLFLSLHTFAQLDTGTGVDGACDENTDYTNGGVFNCATLDINGPLAITPFVAGSPALVIKVQGAVTISSALDLSGENGPDNLTTGAAASGGLGILGGGDGGGSAGGTSQSAGADASDGKTTTTENIGVCGGGGGGGFALAGSNGSDCITTGDDGFGGLAGGTFSSSTLFSLAGFRGGFGGGAGGEGPLGARFGGGAAGGGAIRIIAGNDITISALIDASGGDGGDESINDGGAGGAGSGGVIWLQTNGEIILTAPGLLNVNAGTGGAAPVSGGVGGNSGRGFIRLEESDGVVANAPGISEIIALKPVIKDDFKLTSDIACGTTKSTDQNQTHLIALGFFLAVIVGSVIKILSQYRKSVSKKIVIQN